MHGQPVAMVFASRFKIKFKSEIPLLGTHVAVVYTGESVSGTGMTRGLLDIHSSTK